jgi:hypothetical protein
VYGASCTENETAVCFGHAAMVAMPAFAQSNDNIATGDIIVTARRSEESLQDVQPLCAVGAAQAKA